MKDLEKRTRSVEEAVIEFKHIAKVVLVKMEERLTKLEKDNGDIQKVVYNSCDTKTREISDGDKVTLAKAIGAVLLLFGLFVGAVVYMNDEHSELHEKINHVNENVVANGTTVSHIASSVSEIDRKLDKATRQRYYIRDSLKKRITDE